jgi:hypothetical protein
MADGEVAASDATQYNAAMGWCGVFDVLFGAFGVFGAFGATHFCSTKLSHSRADICVRRQRVHQNVTAMVGSRRVTRRNTVLGDG